MRRLIELVTNPNDVILDPFMGSGSTCVATASLGRKYLGIELDEKYQKIAKARIEEIEKI
jgi:site-specific DNA-methyltransferase (adenine-specific)